ncbi:MAG: hypothetical protein NTW28_16155 [Candidatus Solibacter sp.]|nr:hypothetical protein [Candidatus Solibacter sp.]
MEEKTEATGAHAHAGSCFFCTTAMPMLESLVGEATRDHFRNSRVEFLKGLRSLLDERIAHLAREEPKGTHVTVE